MTTLESMARDAGFSVDGPHIVAESRDGPTHVVCTIPLARFAALVRADALEQAARVPADKAAALLAPKRVSQVDRHTADVLDRCAAAIRALKEQQ